MILTVIRHWCGIMNLDMMEIIHCRLGIPILPYLGRLAMAALEDDEPSMKDGAECPWRPTSFFTHTLLRRSHRQIPS